MNRTEIVQAVKDRCDIEDQTLIVSWVNEGYMILAEVSKIYAEASIYTTNVNNMYEFPDNFIKLHNVIIDGKELLLIEESVALNNPSSGKPTHYFKRGNEIGFYPKPSESYLALIVYTKYPSKLENDSDVPDLPIGYHGALCNFALARYNEKEEEFEYANYYMNQFVNAKAELEAQTNSDNAEAFNFTVE